MLAIMAGVAAMMVLGTRPADAQSGVWTLNNLGNWNDIANWNSGSGPIATGAGNTADFSTIDITAARTVTLDANFTIGSLLFSDKNTLFAWTLTTSGGSVLTLNNGGNSPIIAVTNQTTVISAPIGGTQGFTKVGPAQLTLSGTNTFTGGLTINGGTVLDNFPGGGLNTLILPANSLTLSGGIFNLNCPANVTVQQELANLTINAGQSSIFFARGSNGRNTNVYTGTFSRTAGGTLDIPTYDTTRTMVQSTSGTLGAGLVTSGGVAYITQAGFTDWSGKFSAGTAYLRPVTYTASTATTLAANANVAVATTTLAANTGIASLRDAVAQVTTINLGGFNLTNGGTLVSSAVLAANGLVITNGTLLPPPNQDVVFVQNGAGPLTVAALIADNGTAAALTKSAGGVLILASNNTFSGTTYVNAGTVQVGNGGTSGSLGSSALVQGQGGTLAFNRSDNISFSGSIIGAVGLTQAGSGTLSITADDAFSGNTTISAGTLQLGNGGAAGSISNSPTVFNSSTLAFNTSGAKTFTGSISGNGAILNQGSGSITLTAPINGATASVANTGGGSLVLTSTNNYGGNTTISGGSLVLGPNAGITNSPFIIIGGGAKLDVSSLAVGSLYLNGSPSVKQAIVGTGVVTGSVVTAGSAVLSPATNGVVGTLSFSNNLTLGGGNFYMDITSSAVLDQIAVGGPLALNSGTFVVNVTGSPLPNGSYTLIKYPAGSLTGSANNMTVTFSQVGSVADLDDSTPGLIRLIVSPATPNNLIWGGGVSGDWDLTTLNWTNGVTTSSYSSHDNVTFDDTAVATAVNLTGVLKPGVVLVTNSALNYSFAPSAAGNRLSGGASLTKDGSGTLTLTELNDYSGSTFIKAGTIVLGDNGGNSGNIGLGGCTNNGSLVFNNSDSQIINPAISGSGSLTNDGSGTTILNGNNTYTGDTMINAGTLQVGSGSTSGALGTGAVTNNATLIFNRAGSLAVNNAIAGTGTLINNGPGIVTLGAASSYLNNTYINNGTVKLGVADALPSGGATTGWLVLDGGAIAAGKLDLSGVNQTVNALSGLGGTVNGVVTNSLASATVTNTLTVLGTAVTAYNGAINDSASTAKIGLTLLGTAELRLNGNCNYSGPTLVGQGAILGVGPGYGTSPGIMVLSNSTTFSLHANGSTSVFPGNAISIADNSAASIISSSAANGFGGTVSGGATATNIIGANVSFSTGNVKQFQGMSGTVQVAATGGLRFASTSLTVNGGDITTFEVLGGINTRNGTATGAGISLGALTGTGSLNGAGNADGNGVYVIGAKGIDTTFSGNINGLAPRATSIVKTGAGTQTLDGTLSYDGSTTVNAGVLKIASIGNPATSLDTSANITVTSNAVLDVSDRSDATLNLGNSIAQNLTGYGTIRGSLNEGSTSTVNVGLGTLNVTNVATLSGAINMQLNRTNGVVTNSTIAATSFAISGPLTVTNLGPALQGGDTFKLFSTGVAGFTATNLPALTGSLYWTNKLAVNGTIAVVNPIATYPTNLTAVVNGSNLELSWPADHTGWRLQAQTNALSAGLSGNWVDVVGTAAGNHYTNTVNAANGSVFYRMVYP